MSEQITNNVEFTTNKPQEGKFGKSGVEGVSKDLTKKLETSTNAINNLAGELGETTIDALGSVDKMKKELNTPLEKYKDELHNMLARRSPSSHLKDILKQRASGGIKRA